MLFSDTGRDLRQAIRHLATAPRFAVGIVVSLTLGIVANTAAFSFINAAVFRPFPGVRDQQELVRIDIAAERFASSTWAEYEMLAGGLPGLTGVAAYLRTDLAVTIDRESSALRGAVVSRNYFEVLGVRPAAGGFFPSDAAAPVAVISHDLWRRRFREQSDVIGQLALVNGASVTIVGVTAPHFHGVEKGHFDIDVWLPAGLAHLTLRDEQRHPVSIHAAGFLPFRYVGRRRTDVTLATVAGQAAALQAAIDANRPRNRQGTRISVRRVWLNDPAANGAAIVAYMIVPLLVLLIACVNAGNLLLARASAQRRDWELRLALGASAWRVVRHVLVECLVFAALSAAASLLLAAWVLRFIASSVPVPMPLDGRVLVFTMVAALMAALAFGLGPALRVGRTGLATVGGLRTAYGPSKSRLRSGLIALQAALSLGLLATGAQFVSTVRSGLGVIAAPGAERVLAASFNVEPFNMAPAAAADFYSRVVGRASALEGVVAAGLTTQSARGTFDDGSSIRLWVAPDDPPAGRRGLAAVVSGRYFQAVHASLVAGRYFSSADESAVPRTAIVSEGFARRRLIGRGPGASIRVAAAETPRHPVDLEVVGVVGPPIGERRDLDVVYLPAPLSYTPARALFVQFDDSGRFTLASLQRAVSAIDYRVPIRDAGTLSDQRDDSHGERRLLAAGVAALGIFALALAAGGLYGVVSYLVALRRREIGVRLALGATSSSVMWLILRQGLVPAAIGAGTGAGAAALIGVAVRSRLYGASPVDPAAFAGAAVVLGAAMVTACIFPARHAARIDPAVTLRSE